MGVCPSCIRAMVWRGNGARDAQTPTAADCLALTLDAVGTAMIDYEAEMQSTERYLASARQSPRADWSQDLDWSPTAQLLARNYSACYESSSACSPDQDDVSEHSSSFGGFSKRTAQHAADISKQPRNENDKSHRVLDFKDVQPVYIGEPCVVTEDPAARSRAHEYIHEFFGQNVPNSVRMAEWDLRNMLSPWPVQEELIDRVIERVDIAERDLRETYMANSGAEAVFITPTRMRRQLPVQAETSDRSLAPPSHSSLIRRVYGRLET